MSEVSIAWNRFGLGAHRDDSAPADARAWLRGQFDRYDAQPPLIAQQADSGRIVAGIGDYLMQVRRQKQQQQMGARDGMSDDKPDAMMGGKPGKDDAAVDPVKQARQFARGQARDYYVGAVAARLANALETPTPFVERLVWFWSNHFAVSADKVTTIGIAGAFEFEAIRPHVLGNFRDLLFAVERHPAMLLYLDQAQSVGPDSPIGRRVAARGKRQIGLNENLGREIMELHTLGVRTGYSQADVTEFARALTGWMVGGLGSGPFQRLVMADAKPGQFVFAAPLHEPGARMIMGKRYDQPGERQAAAVLDDLARHPATARHIATKLARHFAGDDPPPAMVARLEQAFLKSDGDLPTVYRAIIDSPEAWAPQPVKFRTPWDWSVAVLRAMGAKQLPVGAPAGLLNQLGQPVWRPGSPAGFDDVAASWAGPDAIMRRVEAAARIADRSQGLIDARQLGPKLFPGAFSATSAQAIARAESPTQGLALLLSSPEFMRR